MQKKYYQEDPPLQTAVSDIEFMLNSDIPKKHLQSLRNEYLLMNKDLKMGFIRESWMLMLTKWAMVAQNCLALQMYEQAHWTIVHMHNIIKMSGSIEGYTLATVSGSQTTQKIIDISNKMRDPSPKSWQQKFKRVMTSKDNREDEL